MAVVERHRFVHTVSECGGAVVLVIGHNTALFAQGRLGAHVFVRLQQHDLKLGQEQHDQYHCGAYTQTHRQCGQLDLKHIK